MVRKLLGKDEVKFFLALIGFLCVICYILLSRFKGAHPGDFEKVYTLVFGLFFALWARIEHLNLERKNEKGEKDGK